MAAVVGDIFDELYSQPETRIQLADALDFLVRCVRGEGSIGKVDQWGLLTIHFIRQSHETIWPSQVMHRGCRLRPRTHQEDKAAEGCGRVQRVVFHLARHVHGAGACLENVSEGFAGHTYFTLGIAPTHQPFLSKNGTPYTQCDDQRCAPRWSSAAASPQV